MKRFFIASTIIIALCCSTVGCGQVKNIDGTTYDTYGFINRGEKKNPNIQYELIWGNIIWGAILCETIIAPIYFFGFSMYEPVAEKDITIIKGAL